MLDSLIGEIFRPLLRGTKLRLVTVALLFSILFAGIEASTQVISLFFLNRRIETTSRLLGSTSLTPEQCTTLAAVEAANIDDLARVNATVHSPGKFLWRMGRTMSFLEGYYSGTSAAVPAPASPSFLNT